MLELTSLLSDLSKKVNYDTRQKNATLSDSEFLEKFPPSGSNCKYNEHVYLRFDVCISYARMEVCMYVCFYVLCMYAYIMYVQYVRTCV